MGLIYGTARLFKFGMTVLQVAAVGFALYEAYKKGQENSIPKSVDSDLRNKFAKGSRNIIDETSWESFPASDAPSSNKFT